MKDEPLTQQVIDQGPVESASKRRTGLLARAAQHPFVTSGFVLAGAGLAYAAVKMAAQSEEVAADGHIDNPQSLRQ